VHARSIIAAIAPLLLAAPLVGQQKPVTPAPAATPVAPKPAVPKPTTVPASVPAPARVAVVVAPARRPQIEITGGVGQTMVDLNTWSGSTANNWSKLAYWGAGRVLFPLGNSLRIGAEVGYHYHFWYTSSSGLSYNYNYPVAATHVGAMVRFPLAGGFTADVGGAIHFFNSVRPGVLAALSYRIPIGPSLVIPIGVRADAVFTNPMVMPIVLNAGVGFSL
jgi:hypothetical protein